ncbi:MAG: hypothetical protein ACE5MH_09665, partial [Terriglobia bacterium]
MAVLSAWDVTVTVAEVVLLSDTLLLLVLQLKVPPDGLPVAVRVMEFGPVEPAARRGTFSGPEIATVGLTVTGMSLERKAGKQPQL